MSKNSTRVSICVPFFKNEYGLKKLLDSIQTQLFRDFEVVITDDSPTDSARAILESYSSFFEIRYYHNVVALGPAKNWNASLENARGEYLKIMHHDDWFSAPDSLQKFVTLMEANPTAVIGFSGSANYDLKGGLKRLVYATKKQISALKSDPTLLCRGNILGAPSVTIVKRGQGILYDPDLKWLVDLDYYMSHLLKYKGQFAITTEILVNISVASGEQLTSFCDGNITVEIGEYSRVYNKIYALNGRSFHAFMNIWSLLMRFGVDPTQFPALVPRSEPFFTDSIFAAKACKLLNTVDNCICLTLKVFNPFSWSRFLIKRVSFLICYLRRA